jgi:hypothetical protein
MSQSKNPTEEEVRGLLEEEGIHVDAEIKYREMHGDRYEQVKARREMTRSNDLLAKARAEVAEA